MFRVRMKQWLGERASLVAVGLFALALFLYALAYLLEKGFTALTPGTVIGAVATALLLAAVSVTIEQYIKTNLTDIDVTSVLRSRELGIQQIAERNIARGRFTGLLKGFLDECREEIVILAYAGDNFIERNRAWIKEALRHGTQVGLLILHPEQLEQADQTEGRDISSHIQKTLGYCRQLVAENPPGVEKFEVRGYTGHLYYTAIFVDRQIKNEVKGSEGTGRVCVQMKANYMSQHQGIVVTFNGKSPYSRYYTSSCRVLWQNSADLLEGNGLDDRNSVEQGAEADG